MFTSIVVAAFAVQALAQSSSSTSSTTASPSTTVLPASQITAVNDCQEYPPFGYYCQGGGASWNATEGVTDFANAPKEFTGCHNHGDDELHCANNTTFERYIEEGGSGNSTGNENIPKYVTGCHTHGSEGIFCSSGDDEWKVVSGLNGTTNLPQNVTGCHSHGVENEIHCSGNGTSITLELEGDDHDHDHDNETTTSSGSQPTPTGAAVNLNAASAAVLSLGGFLVALFAL